jgi:hypothetical protein
MQAMWRGLLGIEDQTLAEKRAAVNGTNLFFGALIGANLGSLERLVLEDYLLLVTMVALVVLYIQLAPVARKRWRRLAELLVVVGTLYLLLMTPFGERMFRSDPPPGPHLFYTVALWMLSIFSLEIRPIAKKSAPALPDKPAD